MRVDTRLAAEVRGLSDDDLLRRLAGLLKQSRRTEAELVAHIAEAEERRLYAREAAKSMFIYCTERLHLSEHETYLRLAAARATRDHPVLLAMLADGRLHLTAIAKLAPHLTAANRDSVLPRAVHATKRQIQDLVAELAPQPDVPTTVRKLPQPAARAQAVAPQRAGGGAAQPALTLAPAAPRAAGNPPAHAPVPPQRAIVQSLSPARYKVQLTISAAFRDKLDRLQALVGRGSTDSSLAAVLEAAVTEKLRRLEARRFGRTTAPRSTVAPADANPGSPYVTAAARRVVDQRDGGQCRFVDKQGNRCSARTQIQHHHVIPRALGGARSPDNIQQMCRTHNLYLAERDYGKGKMAAYRRRPRRPVRPDSS
jgi:hypothetical protein